MKKFDFKLAVSSALAREAHFRADGEGDAKRVVVSVSSEAPYLRMLWDDEVKAWVRGYEVLGHGEGEIDASRMADGLVVQDTHWGDQVGIIDKPEVKDGKLGGAVRFGCGGRAKEIEADALSGIRRNMSVGYIVNAYERTGEKAEDGLPIFRVTSWTPYEASFVNVPADKEVGVGRELDQVKTETRAADVPSAEHEKGKEMNAQEIAALMKTAQKSHVTADEVSDMIAAGKTREQILEVCLARANEHEIKVTEAADAKVKDAEQRMLKAREETSKPVFDEADSKKIQRSYDLMKVIRALGRESVDVGFEREISDQIAKQNHRAARGFYVPAEAFVRAVTGKDNVSGSITGNGAATVETQLLASQYIDALVAKTVLGEAGVTTLPGLTGDIAIPKGTAVTAAWLASENASAAQMQPAFDQITGTPHTIAGNAILSRKLMLQSSLGVETLVQRLILEAIGRGIEGAVFEGTGTSGQPTGLAGATGVNSVSMTAGKPAKKKLVEFWQSVYTANAAGANMKFIGSPAVKALLASTIDVHEVKNGKTGSDELIVGGVGGGYLLKDGKLEGYDFLMSNLCDNKKLYFGDWSQIMLAFWSGVDLTVDPYTLSTSGAWQVTAFQDCDVLVRHPEAFAIGTALA